ncbi:F0F1 ATP synthase subunit epsilon [Buchnera aphidicola (Pemphigus obesinymphae)]|uniref:ATP synthase F1 subunit epsilon n=1 Tax=Buchnera aphidicola TaxID=9 RepID=UPI0022375D70|nr:ATP synthase F1 subunit epsilon [Buchnera aphidicola]MCW5196773.1 F0F1 ATP synthase subunit epsilon [Buchnera aphidicola (Pemphigus obesinymphae)]
MIFQLNIVSFETNIFSGLVEKVRITGSEGELGIYPGHAPLLTFIKKAGYIYFLNNLGKTEYVYISDGILEIQPFEVTVLADNAIRAMDLDYNLILEEKKKAEELIKKNDVNINKKNIKKQLKVVLAKLHIIQMMERS